MAKSALSRPQFLSPTPGLLRVAAPWGREGGSAEGLRGRAHTALAALVALTLVLLGMQWFPGIAQAASDYRINLRVLVITAGNDAADPSTNAIATQLEREGVPYTEIDATAAGRQTIDAAFLADAATNTAKYQAVVLKDNAGTGLAPAELAALVAYERQYGIRQVDAYNYPNANVGLLNDTPEQVYSGALDGGTATVTSAGLSGPFSYLKGTLRIDDYDPAVAEVPGYLAQVNPKPAAGETFTPLITATVGSSSGVLVGVDVRDGREEMTISGSYNPSQVWWNEIATGVVNWMTRGINLGYQRNWFNVQIDDVLVADARWSTTGNCTPGDGCVDPNVTTPDVRMTAADVGEVVAWQNANSFKLDMVFNAGGSGLWYLAQNPNSTLTPEQADAQPDPLRDALLANKSNFTWINHTWAHIFLGCIQLAPTQVGAQWTCAKTAAEADPNNPGRQDPSIPGTQSGAYFWASQAAISEQIKKNLDWATANSLPNFDPTELVTGEHSGLKTLPQQPQDNPFFGPALDALGIKFTAADNSREPAPRTVEGGSAVTVPRYPMNIFYNAGTYVEEVDEYNWIYVSRNNPTEPGGGVCDDNPTTSTCIQPLPAATPEQAKASFDSYIKPLEIRSALTKITANSPRPFYAHQSNLAEDGILYPVLQGVLDQYRAVYNSTAPIVQADLSDQGTQLLRMDAWSKASGNTTAYLDATGVHVPDAAADIPLTMPTGSTTTGATLASYGGELSGWTSGAVTSVPPTRMGGYIPAPSVTAPDAPVIGTATPGNGSVALSWTAPVSTGGTPLNGYIVNVIPGEGAAKEWFVAPDQTSTVVTGLTNGTPYTFTVVAQNDRFMRSAPSAATPSVTPGATPPSAPTGVTATAGNASATVSWTGPASDGGAGISGFVVNAYAAGSTTAAPVVNVPVWNATSAVVQGLANGTAYTFTVAAVNAAGTGAASEPSSAVTPVSTPAAPTITSVTGGDASATVTWTAPTDTGGSPITGWDVQALASGSTTPAGAVTIDGAALSATVTGLTNGTPYTLSVAAKNAQGTGTAVTSAAVTPAAPIVVPGAPTITGTTAGDTQVTVNWTAPADGTATSITGYTVTAYVGDGTTVVTTAPAGATDTSAVVKGLTNGTGYTFTVTALNGATTGTPSARSQAATPQAPLTVPGAPGIGTATAGNASATVTWTAPGSNGGSPITGYIVTVYNGDTEVKTVPAAADATTATVPDLANGTAYTFTVTATNAQGNGTPSARSLPVTPVAPTAAPGAPTVTSVTARSTEVALAWAAPADNGGSPVTGYTVRVFEGDSTTPKNTITTDGSTLTATVTGLTNGTAYTFTVAATNAVGTGPESGRSASATPAGVPGVPTIGTVTAGDRSASVTWLAPSDTGGSPLTGYVVSAFTGGSTTPAATTTVSASATGVTLDGLTNGTQYTISVAATNALGTGTAATSAAVTPVAAATVPGAPGIGAATAGDRSATVTWTAPSSDGGSRITEYTVRAYSGTTEAATVTAAAGDTSATVSGLTNGTAYTFTVSATNAVGSGPESGRSDAVTPVAGATVPGAPVIGEATAGDGTATVTWTAPSSDGGSPITGYTVTVYIGDTVDQTISAGPAADRLAISGLTNGTAYTFAVAAENLLGASPQSGRSNSVTPVAAATVPGAPVIGTATAGDRAATVTWTAPTSNGGSSITGYTVRAYNGATEAASVTAAAGDTSATVSGLTNGTAYTFTVSATNAVGSGPESGRSNEVTPAAAATVPGAPAIGTATAGDRTATVTWTAPSSDGGSPITGYQVTVYIGDTVDQTISAGPAADRLAISGLTNGTAYTFAVAAENLLGASPESGRSNSVTPVAATAVPGAPVIGTATAGDGSATVTWTAPSSDGGSRITEYTVRAYNGTTEVTKVTAAAGDTSATVSGLTNGTAYTFTVSATNAVGSGPESGRSDAVTPVAATAVPGAPGIGTATAGDRTATVTWTAPTSDGGSSITGYTVRAYSGTTEAAKVTAAAGDTSATVSGLTNGTAYTFTVSATNAVGSGPESGRSNEVTPAAAATVPGAPAIGTATAGDRTATVTWTAPSSDGGSPITGYQVTVYIGDTVNQTISAGPAADRLAISGLTNGTAYTFAVAAKNQVGTGAQSDRSNSVTPKAAATVPGAPVIGTATAGDRAATVTWTAPSSDGGSAITGYTVTAYSGTTEAAKVSAAAGDTSATVSGLTNGTAYTFTVAAVNGVGTGAASAASAAVIPTATTAVPGAPTIGAVTAGSRTATVNWTAPAQTGTSAISGYTVTVYSGTGATVVKTVTAGAAAKSLTVTGLTNGTAYTFTVAARNASGAGPASERSASVTPAALPGTPRIRTVTAGDASATLTWTAPTNNGGSPITGYVITTYGGSTKVPTVTVPADPTTATITGLTNGTAYRFTVAAVTAAGTGQATDRSTAVTPAVQPGAPTIGTVTPGNRSATVSWTVPAQAGTTPITGYVVNVYSGTSETPTKKVTTGRSATKVTVSGLANGTAYTFTVAAVTRTGTGPASERSQPVTPAVPIVKPGAPTMRTVTAGNASATVTWRAPRNTGGAPITSYVVYVYQRGSGTALTTVTVDGATTQTKVTGLVNGTRYTFRVAAVNSAGTSALSGRSASVTPRA